MWLASEFPLTLTLSPRRGNGGGRGLAFDGEAEALADVGEGVFGGLEASVLDVHEELAEFFGAGFFVHAGDEGGAVGVVAEV